MDRSLLNGEERYQACRLRRQRKLRAAPEKAKPAQEFE